MEKVTDAVRDDLESLLMDAIDGCYTIAVLPDQDEETNAATQLLADIAIATLYVVAARSRVRILDVEH